MMSAHETDQKWYAVDLSYETPMYANDSFPDYPSAVAYLDEVIDAWETELQVTADRSLASSNNMYAARCGNWTAQVVIDHDVDQEAK